MTASEARAALPAILDRVLAGEEVTVTRHGKAVAVIVRPDALAARRANESLASAERLRGILEEARSRPLYPRPGLTEKRAEDLVAGVRDARAGA